MDAKFTVTVETPDTHRAETHRVQAARVPAEGEDFALNGHDFHVRAVSWRALTDPFVGAVVAEANVLLAPGPRGAL